VQIIPPNPLQININLEFGILACSAVTIVQFCSSIECNYTVFEIHFEDVLLLLDAYTGHYLVVIKLLEFVLNIQ
jgi:hypothetical protein